MIEEIRKYVDERNKLLENNSEFKTISIHCSIKGDKIALKCCFTDIYEYKDKVVYALKHENIENTLEAIQTWVNHIVEGVHIVRELNSMIREHQKESNSPIRVIYKFGYSLDDNVKIIDWDYNKVVIKLNKKSICNLISYYNTIEDIINLSDYNCSVVKMIENFNKCKLHTVIGATIVGEVIDILKHNMLCRKDILKMISENSTYKGTQKIKSIFSIRELGIMAIFIWNIDFDAGIVDTTLMDNKILNVYEDVYIRDSNICSAIHSLYGIKAREIYDIFKINS